MDARFDTDDERAACGVRNPDRSWFLRVLTCDVTLRLKPGMTVGETDDGKPVFNADRAAHAVRFDQVGDAWLLTPLKGEVCLGAAPLRYPEPATLAGDVRIGTLECRMVDAIGSIPARAVGSVVRARRLRAGRSARRKRRGRRFSRWIGARARLLGRPATAAAVLIGVATLAATHGGASVPLARSGVVAPAVCAATGAGERRIVVATPGPTTLEASTIVSSLPVEPVQRSARQPVPTVAEVVAPAPRPATEDAYLSWGILTGG